MSILKHSGLRALGAASVAVFALSACSGGSSNDALPLIRANLSIKAVSQGGVCEVIPVRVTPKELRGQANKYSNNRMMVTDVTMTGPTDENGAPMCNGSGQTLPLAVSIGLDPAEQKGKYLVVFTPAALLGQPPPDDREGDMLSLSALAWIERSGEGVLPPSPYGRLQVTVAPENAVARTASD